MSNSGWTQILAVIACFLWTSCIAQNNHNTEDVDAKYWQQLGKDGIKEALGRKYNEGVAKNVILFVGDGMGLSTIVAGRIFKGQQAGHSGEEGFLAFEKFPNVGLLKTYNVDRQVPDSAGTATALFSGIKTNYYVVGLNAHSVFNVCRSDVQENAKVKSLIDWGIEAKKSTGVVTTTRLTHATPASAYAHIPHRDWECDSKIPETERGKGCIDIARQMVEEEPGRNINVLLGGGEQVFVSGVNRSTACTRSDDRNLPYDWMQFQKGQNRSYRYVKNKRQLLEVPNDTDNVLGLFSPSHMPYDKDRDTSETGEPSLEEMTEKAIQILSRNSKGYVLLVEGGRIDHAHHDNLAKVAIEEVVAFDKAIKKALSITKASETLIIVTADHSHSFTINGYPKRGNPIDGIGDVTPEGFAYETLSYINGPGYTNHRMEVDDSLRNKSATTHTWRNLNVTLQNVNRTSLRKEPHLAGFWMDSETHGGEDVPVYASGPMAHLLYGVHEQTHVPYAIAYSTCIGPYLKNCREFQRQTSSSVVINASVLTMFVGVMVSSLLAKYL